MIDPAWVSALSAILFIIGLGGAFTRKNAIIVLMCIELMRNAANMQFAAAAVHHGDPTGWGYTIFAIAIAASEVAIGLAIFLAKYPKGAKRLIISSQRNQMICGKIFLL